MNESFCVARQLQKRLEEMGMTGNLTTRWAGQPTVTASAKPAIPPLIDQIGDLDHRGHQLHDQLPSVIGPEIERLALCIQALLAAGWSSVQIVTDHGWPFCPGGLPSAELPKHLTASKWARCAAIKGESQVQVPTAAWSWNPAEIFAAPAGAACFNTGGSYSYAHGDISLQECLTPAFVVSGGASSAAAVAITEICWKGLRCNLEVCGGTAGMTADLSREAAGGPSVAKTAKPVDDGGARLPVEDDELEGAAVVAVLLSPGGRVITQRRTVVGADNA